MKWKGNRNGTKEEVRRKVEIQRDRVLEGKEPAGRNAERHTRTHTDRQTERGRERKTNKDNKRQRWKMFSIEKRQRQTSTGEGNTDMQRQNRQRENVLEVPLYATCIYPRPAG